MAAYPLWLTYRPWPTHGMVIAKRPHGELDKQFLRIMNPDEVRWISVDRDMYNRYQVGDEWKWPEP